MGRLYQITSKLVSGVVMIMSEDIECWHCGETTECEEPENLIMIQCSCGKTLKGQAYPQTLSYKSTLFTKRHFEWMVNMALHTSMTKAQCDKLSLLLEGTNENYDASRFRSTLTLTRNKNSGGI